MIERPDIHNFVDSLYKRGLQTDIHSSYQLREWFVQLGCWCYWCCGPFEVIDHVWPICLGGTSNTINLVPSCITCNSRKGALDLPIWCRMIGFPYPLPVGEVLG